MGQRAEEPELELDQARGGPGGGVAQSLPRACPSQTMVSL